MWTSVRFLSWCMFINKLAESPTGPVQIWFHIVSAQKGGYKGLSKFLQCFTNNADDGIENTCLKFTDSFLGNYNEGWDSNSKQTWWPEQRFQDCNSVGTSTKSDTKAWTIGHTGWVGAGEQLIFPTSQTFKDLWSKMDHNTPSITCHTLQLLSLAEVSVAWIWLH